MVKTVCWVYVPIPNQSTREILDNWIPLTGSGIEGDLRRGERKSVMLGNLGGMSGWAATVPEEVS
jgi:hypothetical protein